MRIFDGSAQVNPSGVHSGAIQVDGAAQRFTHEIVALFFLETYPNTPVSHIHTDDWSRLTDMISEIFSQHCLHGLGLIVFVLGNIRNVGAPICVNRNGNRSRSGLGTIFRNSLYITWYGIWNMHVKKSL